jgi:transcriptional regulator with XRE-family HTH domain
MAEMTMNQTREWLLRMADEEANCEVSAGGLAHEAGLLNRGSLSESARLSLAKFLELSRRQMNESLESLADKAGVDLVELTSLERGKGLVRSPKILVKIAAVLHVDVQPLLELSGLITTTDERLVRIAAQFSARLESVKPLEPEEEQALGWFKEQAFRPRSKSAAAS